MTESCVDAQADLLFLHHDQMRKRDDAATECVTIMPPASHFRAMCCSGNTANCGKAKLWQA